LLKKLQKTTQDYFFDKHPVHVFYEAGVPILNKLRVFYDQIISINYYVAVAALLW